MLSKTITSITCYVSITRNSWSYLSLQKTAKDCQYHFYLMSSQLNSIEINNKKFYLYFFSTNSKSSSASSTKCSCSSDCRAFTRGTSTSITFLKFVDNNKSIVLIWIKKVLEIFCVPWVVQHTVTQNNWPGNNKCITANWK